MRKNLNFVVSILIFFFLIGCGENEDIIGNDPDVTDPDTTNTDTSGFLTDPFGSDSTLDVLTWNVEHYPKSNSTIDSLRKLIEILDVDIIAFQEVETSPMDLAITQDWEVVYQSNSNLGFLVNTGDNITINETFSLFSGSSREFPRLPFVLSISYRGEEIYIINNHLKAFGDNVIDHNYAWDEEKRRLDACNMLEEYCSRVYPDDNVIILGDFNDQINDETEANVFTAFVGNEKYFIVDSEYAELNMIDNKSYPSYNSHIDHIIISDELILNYVHVKTIQAELYFPGRWNTYDSIISDHRPVGINLKF